MIVVQLLFFVLQLVKAEIDATLREQFLVRAFFAQTAFVKHQDAIGVLDGAQAMGDYEGGAARQEAAEGFANQQFSFRVDAGSGFVED